MEAKGAERMTLTTATTTATSTTPTTTTPLSIPTGGLKQHEGTMISPRRGMFSTTPPEDEGGSSSEGEEIDLDMAAGGRFGTLGKSGSNKLDQLLAKAAVVGPVVQGISHV